MADVRALPATIETVESVTVEVLTEAQYDREVEQRLTQEKQRVAEQILKQDQFARDRAFRLLKRCQGGSIPNLLQGWDLNHFDAILASKVVVRLLQISFLVHGRQRQPEQTSAYALPANAELVLSCGGMLFDLGGITLMERVIEQWIPAFDQAALRTAWRSIGG